MILEALLLFGGFYIFLGLSIYAYSIVFTYNNLNIWSFRLWINGNKFNVGIVEFPVWMLVWLKWFAIDVKEYQDKEK